jgi:hypothetical protein
MTNLRVLTVEQVADMVQLSTKTVLRAIACGDLEASQLARRGAWRIDPDASPRWMARRSNLHARHDPHLVMPSSDGAVLRRGASGPRPAALVVTAEMGRR